MAYGKFLSGTINILRKRAGERCSLCNVTTSKPTFKIDGWTNLGEAAHIKGRRDGPNLRFDKSMTDPQRAEIRNAIWLCKICHKKVDSDSNIYTVDFLHKVRAKHEKNVSGGIFDKNYSALEREKEIEHDVNIFEKLDEIFPEEMLEKYLSHIEHFGWVDLNEEEHVQLDTQSRTYKLASNKYLNSEIDKSFQSFEYKILFLHIYMIDSEKNAQRFFPPKIFSSFRATFGLEEVLGEFGYFGMTSYAYKWYYDRYKQQIMEKTKEIREEYAKYRQSIKRNIYK